MNRCCLLLVSTLLVLLTWGCAETLEPTAPPSDDYPIPSEDDDLIASSPGGKFDTGYYSNLAAEIEGVLLSVIREDVSELEADARQERLDELSGGGYTLSSLVNRQIKYGKNAFDVTGLHMNLSGSDAEVLEASLSEEGIITIRYQATVETLVTTAELEETGTTIQQILEREYSAIVPDAPNRMASAVGIACVDDEHQETPPEDYNYFYYFQPEREGCADAMAQAGIERVTATLALHNLAPSETVFPEYDQLVADSRIDVVVFFGAADHDWEPGKWDWGVYSHSNFTRALSSRGFSRQDANHGDLYTRTVDGLVENITVIGPETLKLLKNDEEGIFESLVSNSEIIFYNGHSFYGSLSVLRDASIYPGHYQIFFINSCWSYEYYTNQIFTNNVTEQDPNGWALADVVNNTEAAWFHNMEPESRILLTNILAGAESNGVDGDRYYTWDRIIGAMNEHAVNTQRSGKSHEIYGVSGVTTNQFDPTATPPPTGETTRYEATNRAAIPDNDEDGVSDVIVVPDGHGSVGSVTIEVAIEHTWIGDLEVILYHGDRHFVLHSQSGGSDDNLNINTTTAHFSGLQAEGEWLLTITDNASQDEGELVSWAITL